MADSEKYRNRIRKIIDFYTSLKGRTIVGVSITLVLVCVIYVIPYFIPKLWDFILALTR